MVLHIEPFTCTNIVTKVRQGKSVLISALRKSTIPWIILNCSFTAGLCVLCQQFGRCVDIKIILPQNQLFVLSKYELELN